MNIYADTIIAGRVTMTPVEFGLWVGLTVAFPFLLGLPGLEGCHVGDANDQARAAPPHHPAQGHVR
jgi:hypothetical protein